MIKRLRASIASRASKLKTKEAFLPSLICLLSLLCLLWRPAYAAFEDTGTGARPTALGDTYVAAGDDVMSLMVNPAGLAQLHLKQISSEYSKLYTGLTDGSNLSQYFMGYGQPIRWGGTLAAGVKQFSLDDLYKERTISLGYGEWVTSSVAVGGAVKQLYHAFGAPNIIVDDAGNIQSGTPSFFAQNGNSQTAYSADLGMLYRWTDRHTIGVSVQNINEPNVALSPSDHEVVGRTVRGGLNYRVHKDFNLLAAVATKQSLANQRDTTWTGAAERWWEFRDNSAVAVRGSLATGSREFRQAAMGASYRIGSFQIDYAFVFNIGGITLGDTAGTHRFSFAYNFGAPPAPPVVQSLSQAKVNKASEHDIEEMVNAKMIQGNQVSTPAVTPADFEVPIPAAPAPVLGSRPVKIDSREALLVRLSLLLKTPSPDRLAALESQFDLWHGYFQSTGLDLVELMGQEDTLEDTARYYAHIRWLNAPARERLSYLARSLEKYLEPALRHRAWDLQDARDLRYKAWLQLAWAYQRSLPARGMTLNDQIASLQRIVTKAIIFERQPPEPVSLAPRVAPKPRPKSVVTAPVRPIPQKTYEHPSDAQIRYEKALLQYSRRVAAGASLSERIKLLKKILANCQQADLDCRLAYQEFEATFDEELQGAK